MLIRLIGPGAECAAALNALRDHPMLQLVHASEPYPCHPDPAVQVYAEATLRGWHHRPGRPAKSAAPRLDPDHVGIARAMGWRR